MTSSLLLLAPVTATLILLAGIVDDLRSRKFHNWLFVSCLALGLGANGISGGWSGLSSGFLGIGTGLCAFLPLVLIRATGAGDMKLLMAFGAASYWSAVLYVAAFSILWGAAFGVTRVMLSGQGRTLLQNMMTITATRTGQGLELHTVPYSFAILMGWLTFIIYSQRLA